MGINVVFNEPGSLGNFEFVQGDTLPNLMFHFVDEETDLPKDVTGVVAEIRVRDQRTKKPMFKQEVQIPAITALDGVGVLQWAVGALDIPSATYEGEISLTFPDSTVETIFDILEFEVRDKFYD